MNKFPSVQQQRLLAFEPPFPDKQYALLISLHGTEGLSRLYDYKLEVVTTNDQLHANDVLGKFVNFSLLNPHEKNQMPARQFHGMITEFTAGERTVFFKANQELNCRRYFLRVAPTLWLLTKSMHNRVFQRSGQHVIDIVQSVLKPYNIKVDVSQVTKPLLWEYCTQYYESDFAFFSRILAQSGIYYYFKQNYNEHILVLANSTQGYSAPAIAVQSWHDIGQQPAITIFNQNFKIACSNFAATNADIEQGNVGLFNQQAFKANSASPMVATQTMEFIFPAAMKTNSDGQEITAIAAEREVAQSQFCQIESDYSELKAGDLIKFDGDYFADLASKEQVITYLEFSAKDDRGNASAGEQYNYRNRFIVIPGTVCFRPPLLPKPNPGYFQLATIVNASGKTSAEQPINSDKYGRHSVKFIWENNPANPENTNTHDQCRIRVLNNWDNGNYRVGTPVVIGFIDADIDKPIILGATNDAFNLPQGEYSATNEYTSIIKRYPGSDDGSNYNAITFNDKKNQELLAIFAGKDFTTLVNKGNRLTHIKNGDEHFLLEKGNEVHEIRQGQRRLTIGGHEIHRNEANFNHSVAENYYLEVKGNLVIKTSGNLDLRSQGKISINGNELNVNINGAASINSQSVSINGRTTMNIQGLSVDIKGPGGVKIN